MYIALLYLYIYIHLFVYRSSSWYCKDMSGVSNSTSLASDLQEVLAMYDEFVDETATQLARGEQLEKIVCEMREENQFHVTEHEKNAAICRRQSADITRLASEVHEMKKRETEQSQRSIDATKALTQNLQLKLEVEDLDLLLTSSIVK
jgi:hypothetical protein